MLLVQAAPDAPVSFQRPRRLTEIGPGEQQNVPCFEGFEVLLDSQERLPARTKRAVLTIVLSASDTGNQRYGLSRR